MSDRVFTGLFVAEGTSDLPLADLVEAIFVDRGVLVRLSKPDFSLLGRVAKDVESRVRAGVELLGGPVDLVVVHRDADNAGYEDRSAEIVNAVESAGVKAETVKVIPVRMTEAWLLLDEAAIRRVAGRPTGRQNLGLPHSKRVETVPDPKEVLRRSLLKAADVTGRRGDRVAKRFVEHRRHLLERLDHSGPVANLSGWRRMVEDIDVVVEQWNSRDR